MDRFHIEVDAERTVSALLLSPSQPAACFVFAHGAGAGMTHPFMERVARRLLERDIATLRYQFPYMEARAKRPDPAAIAQATVRAAVTAARKRHPKLKLIAGGKSFGGRVTSQAQASAPLPGVDGLVFLGFPLHPAGRPSLDRAAHLTQVHIPMLFLQGTRDKLAEPSLMRTTSENLGARATLHFVEAADHSFHVAAKSGRTDAEVINELGDVLVDWLNTIEI
jgi:uncharacterized protein